MTLFEYTATIASGEEIHGVIRAADESEAAIRLKESYTMIHSLNPVEEKTESELLKKKHRKYSDKALAMVCRQFAIILTAGLPIVRSIELVAGQTEDKNLKELLIEVAKDTSSGFSLADSFYSHAPDLPTTFIETLRAGELSGSLSMAFDRLSNYYGKASKVRAKIISALTYPAFVLAVAVVVIMIIMVYAVPVFSQTFLELGTELPWPTRALIATSNFFSKWIWLILLILAVLVIGIKVYSMTEEGKYNIAKILLSAPIIGKIQLMNASSQFASTFSTMMAAGLPAFTALSITGRSMSNAYLGRAVGRAVENVEAGFRIGASMKETNLFPDLLVEMTSVGEESGSIEETLNVIGEFYDSEVDTLTTRAVALIEPAIIVVLAVFVCFVLLAVYLPMFSMYEGIS